MPIEEKIGKTQKYRHQQEFPNKDSSSPGSRSKNRELGLRVIKTYE